MWIFSIGWYVDPTYQEQYYMKNQSPNVDHGRHERNGRSSISIDISVVVIVVIWFLYFVFKIY